LEEQIERTIAEFNRKKDEIISVARSERQKLGHDLIEDKYAYEEALHLESLIKEKMDDALDVANKDAEVVRDLAEHRNEIIRKTNIRIDDITADLAVVLDAYGWFPDESDDDST
jgi:hypothetical protein